MASAETISVAMVRIFFIVVYWFKKPPSGCLLGERSLEGGGVLYDRIIAVAGGLLAAYLDQFNLEDEGRERLDLSGFASAVG